MEKTKLPSFVTVLILTLITVIMWISFEVYRVFVKPTPSSVPETVSAQISPTLDQEAIDLFKTNLFLNDSDIPDSVVGVFNPPEGTPIASPLTEQPSTEQTETLPEESPVTEEETATGSGQAI